MEKVPVEAIVGSLTGFYDWCRYVHLKEQRLSYRHTDILDVLAVVCHHPCSPKL